MTVKWFSIVGGRTGIGVSAFLFAMSGAAQNEETLQVYKIPPEIALQPHRVASSDAHLAGGGG